MHLVGILDDADIGALIAGVAEFADRRRAAREQPETEARCEFCAKRYVLTADEVSALTSRLG